MYKNSLKLLHTIPSLRLVYSIFIEKFVLTSQNFETIKTICVFSFPSFFVLRKIPKGKFLCVSEKKTFFMSCVGKLTKMPYFMLYFNIIVLVSPFFHFFITFFSPTFEIVFLIMTFFIAFLSHLRIWFCYSSSLKFLCLLFGFNYESSIDITVCDYYLLYVF